MSLISQNAVPKEAGKKKKRLMEEDKIKLVEERGEAEVLDGDNIIMDSRGIRRERKGKRRKVTSNWKSRRGSREKSWKAFSLAPCTHRLGLGMMMLMKKL